MGGGGTSWEVEKPVGGVMLLLDPQTHKSPCQDDRVGALGWWPWQRQGGGREARSED